jgi:phosphoglycerate dehydrogenase-like enzyme
MPTVLIHCNLPVPIDGNRLRGRRDDLSIVTAETRTENYELLSEADVLITSNMAWEDEYLDELEASNWVQTIGAGYDAFPVERFRERGIMLTNAVGIHGPSAGEHVFALALAFSRGVPTYLKQQRRHEWTSHLNGEWANQTVTILGLGAIGEAVAKRARGFDMDVWGIKRDPSTYDGCLPADRVIANDEAFRPLTNDEAGIFGETNLLVVVVPLTDTTRGLVDASVLDALPESALLVNISRGPVVDEEALIAAIERDIIGGAGLDVTVDEPLPDDSPLWDLDDVIITPHVAGVSDQYDARFAEVFLNHYDQWRAGQEPELRIV